MAETAPKIMIVDDDPGLLLTFEGIMEDEGYDVVAAEDGYQAVEAAKANAFALIFMDIKMPGMNGVQAYRAIKEVSPNSVVVMMTGFSLEGLVKEALEEGAYAVIYKPYSVEQIMDIVQAVLQTVFLLVVDDRAADRETLRAVLEESGFGVSIAENGPQAIAMAAKRHYRAIIMDVKMPGMDGFTACQEIRKFDPMVKVIFITAYELEPPVREALLSGAYTVVTKPVDPEELLSLIRTIT